MVCRFKLLSIALVVFLNIMSSGASACGESLYRVGKGVEYRDYTAPLPGNIIIVANTDGELLMAERIAAAGHHVKIVSRPEEISESLQQEAFDIILATYEQRIIVESEINNYAVTYLPVAMEGSAELKQAHNTYKQSLSSNGSVKQFLKTIHNVLKDRQV